VVQSPRWLESAERKFGFLAIPNLGLVLVALQALGSLLLWFKAGSDPDAMSILLERLVLDPQAVFAGEVWRIVTFLAIPLSTNLLMIIVLWFLYFVLSSLAQSWGDFKLTVYILIAWIGTVLASLIFQVPVESFLLIESSFFFALATLIPDYEVLLFFLVPVKIKWVALVTAVMMFFIPLVFSGWDYKLYLIVASLNYILFFGPYFFDMGKKWLQQRKR